MNNWLIPCSIDIFRVHEYFATYNIIDWKQSHYKFQEGDIVYIYCSKPEMKVCYKCIVIQPNIEYSEAIHDEEYWGHKHIYNAVAKQNRYVRMKLIGKEDSSDLSLQTLISHGLKMAPQGPQKIKREFLDYIQSVF